jgi:hypothetical protein
MCACRSRNDPTPGWVKALQCGDLASALSEAHEIPVLSLADSLAISRLAAVLCTVIDLDLYRARAARRERDTCALAHLLTVTYEISDRVSPSVWGCR